MPGVELRLADDGEVELRGDCVFAGYRGQEEKTRETFTEDGWLKTGDIGELDEDGYLSIVDRKKELIINAAGKNMSPANIESTLKADEPADRLRGRDRRPAPVQRRADRARPRGRRELRRRVARGRVAEAIETANERLSKVEQIKRHMLLDTEWEPGGDELTPTMKLKRKPIAEKYAEEIDALYEREPG